MTVFLKYILSFNTQPPEGGWQAQHAQTHQSPVSTHSRPKAAGSSSRLTDWRQRVSTHSRPKAAGPKRFQNPLCQMCFNTQPPEGGWSFEFPETFSIGSFNTQPPEGGWIPDRQQNSISDSFNTQPPEGGWVSSSTNFPLTPGFNTQPPEGGWNLIYKFILSTRVSTHSRPKAAGRRVGRDPLFIWFQHTAARRRLGASQAITPYRLPFQHTAARRRLVKPAPCEYSAGSVSTHSRPKAAGRFDSLPEAVGEFQHTAARRRLALEITSNFLNFLFQHTAARRRLVGVSKACVSNLFTFQHTAARRRLDNRR